MRPCVPAAWSHYRIDYRHGGSTYQITVHPRPDGTALPVVVDGRRRADGRIPLVDDGQTHEVRIGQAPAGAPSG